MHGHDLYIETVASWTLGSTYRHRITLLNDPVDIVVSKELTKDFELGIVPSPSDIGFEVATP